MACWTRRSRYLCASDVEQSGSTPAAPLRLTFLTRSVLRPRRSPTPLLRNERGRHRFSPSAFGDRGRHGSTARTDGLGGRTDYAEQGSLSDKLGAFEKFSLAQNPGDRPGIGDHERGGFRKVLRR